ncbi:MAG: WG repeat-containing protein [Candidatus Izemoplasmatales bacterium]|nr:WG repeat-containing protein [Candidatus Izemoplasmatales bacterium]
MKRIFVLFLFLSLFLSGCSLFGGSENSDEKINLFSSGLLAVELDDKWGYVDENGDVAIELVYDNAGAFYGKSAIVELNNEMKLINNKGENLLDKSYEKLFRDENTGNIFYFSNERWGLMDETGEILTDALYEEVNEFQDSRALVMSGDKYGFIDQKGKNVVSLKYDDGRTFSNGLASVKNNEKWGYIDEDGEIVIDFFYDTAYSFDEYGNAIVKIDEVYSLIDKDNNKIISNVDKIKGEGPLYAVENDDVYTIYNQEGERINNLTFEYVWYTEDYIVNAEDDEENDMVYLFDEDGKVSRSGLYDDVSYGYIANSSKIEVVFIEYDEDYLNIYIDNSQYRIKGDDIGQVYTDKFVVEKDEKYGIVNQDDEIILEFLYDYLVFTDDGFLIFVINEKFGIMDKNFDKIMIASYEALNPYYNITSLANYYF